MTYLDNAATTLKKPRGTLRAVAKSYANAGRGGHKLAMEASAEIENTRALLAEFFTVLDPSHIAFTQNTTDSLNHAIHGVVKEGDHIIISGMEHNSVARPAFASNAEVSVVHPNKNGKILPGNISKEIRENTRLIATTHASNVTGTINPISEIGTIARENDVLFLVDAAQTAGVLPINTLDYHIDLLAFPAHKMLFGVQGVGGLYVREGLDLTPLKQGGTGSMSEDLTHPSFMPDSIESGTQNTAGISALGKGLEFINKIGLPAIREHEQKLTEILLEAFGNMPHIQVYGNTNAKTRASSRVGVVGFNVLKKDGTIADCVEIANCLSTKQNIALRAGFHCAALAHESMGTAQTGMLRASFSWFTKKREVYKLIDAINKTQP